MQWNAIYLGSLQLWQIPETAEFALVPVLAQDLIMEQAHQLVLDLGVVETLAPALAAAAKTVDFAPVPVLAQDLIMEQAHQLVLDLGVVETLAPALAAVAVAAEAVTAVAAAGLALSLRSALPVG